MTQRFKMHPQRLSDFLARFSKHYKGTTKSEKGFKTEFTKRMNAIDATIKPRLIWNSSTQGTYVSSDNGLLK